MKYPKFEVEKYKDAIRVKKEYYDGTQLDFIFSMKELEDFLNILGVKRGDIDLTSRAEQRRKRLLELLEEIKELQLNKGIAYSGLVDNLRLFGWRGVIIRMGDKYIRILNLMLMKKEEISEESIIDNLKDLAVYALLCIAMIEQQDEGIFKFVGEKE